MLIFSKIDELKKMYRDDCRIRKNGTILLGSDKDLPLYSRHTLFKPLTQDLIDEYLINNYKYHIPDQYTSFLKYSNGMSLFSTKRNVAGFKIASYIFTIFGISLTPPYARLQDMEEPFDIRIEDLGRHDDIAENWLKCGSYKNGSNLYVTYDIFIDTATNYVYSCIKNDNKIVREWNSFDLCLCDLFDDLKSTKTEY